MNYEAFLQTLPIMGKGMAGIFLVTGVIVLCILILGKNGQQTRKIKSNGLESTYRYAGIIEVHFSKKEGTFYVC